MGDQLRQREPFPGIPDRRRQDTLHRQLAEPAGLSGRLRRAGFTYLLLAETLPRDDTRYDPTLTRLADAQLASATGDGLLPLLEYLFPDADGDIRRYRLVRLCDSTGSR